MTVQEAFIVLGVDEEVDFETAHRMYKRQLQLFHPDLNPHHNPESIRKLNAAWAMVRQHYEGGSNSEKDEGWARSQSAPRQTEREAKERQEREEQARREARAREEAEARQRAEAQRKREEARDREEAEARQRAEAQREREEAARRQELEAENRNRYIVGIVVLQAIVAFLVGSLLLSVSANSELLGAKTIVSYVVAGGSGARATYWFAVTALAALAAFLSQLRIQKRGGYSRLGAADYLGPTIAFGIALVAANYVLILLVILLAVVLGVWMLSGLLS